MQLFPLYLFPEDSLATSVSTTVWVGIWVVAFFNLRLGWTASGLVVPGYLVPLLFAKPISVGVVVLEAIVTYLIAYGLSEIPSRHKAWCSFFGRDRFFVVVLVSIVVRSVMDGWVLPMCGQAICEWWNVNFDYRNHLHSYGLVIVSLAANYLWKPGLKQGLTTIGVTTGVTFLLVRFVLMELANFSINDVEFMYADIASSLLASPKAYIILITTSFMASFSNLRYGWDFNGILIPALLALHWNDPLKIVASMGEAGVILVLAMAVMKIPYFNGLTMEGMRKILLFFNVAFALRIFIGFIGPMVSTEMRVTDLYGFGYLLSTLIAIKAYEKRRILKLMRATLRVSTTGVAFGSIVGFALLSARLADSYPLRKSDRSPEIATATDTDGNSETVLEVIRRDRSKLFRNQLPESYHKPTSADVDAFANGVRALLRSRQNELDDGLTTAKLELARANFEVQIIDGRFAYIREVAPARGWGVYLVDLDRNNGLSVQVPAPIDEWGSLDAALFLFQEFDSKSLAIAGCRRETNSDMSADVLGSKRSIYATFSRLVSNEEVLEVRGKSPEIERLLSRTTASRRPTLPLNRSVSGGVHEIMSMMTSVLSRNAGDGVHTDLLPASSLWVKREVPQSLDLGKLKTLLPELAVEWRTSGLRNYARERTWSGFVELTLNGQDCERLITRAAMKRNQSGPADHTLPRLDEGNIRHCLLEQKQFLARQGTEQFVRPEIEDMLYFDKAVLSPMLELAHNTMPPNLTTPLAPVRAQYAGAHAVRPDHTRCPSSQHDESWLQRLTAVSTAANVMGYGVTCFFDRDSCQHFLVLSENAPCERHWGTFAVKVGGNGSVILEVPRPIAEACTFDTAIQFAGREDVLAIAMAGSHPLANLDRTADVTVEENSICLFQLFRQVMMRESGGKSLLSLEVRGFTGPEGVSSIFATSDGATSHDDLSPLAASFARRLNELGYRLEFADGNEELVGYEVSGSRQLLAARQYLQHEFATLWLAPHHRSRFSQLDNTSQSHRFQLVGIPTVHADVATYLFPASDGQMASLPENVVDDISNYLRTRDVVRLYAFARRWSECDWVRVVDTHTGQAFLVTGGSPRLPIVVNVGNRNRRPDEPMSCVASDATTLRPFLDSAASILVVERDRNLTERRKVAKGVAAYHTDCLAPALLDRGEPESGEAR